MSITALNPTMPQGLQSSNAANRTAPSSSSRNSTQSHHATVLSKERIAQWMANSAVEPSEDLKNFVSTRKADLSLDPTAHVPEPRKRTRRVVVTTDDTPAKIPRPPNAFMIFRSDLIKDVGLAKLEKKQQNLSVIAGEIWNMMPEQEKQNWRTKAMSRLHEHQEKHPQYKYTPKQRNGRGKKADKEPSPSFADPAVREQWRTQNLSEIYHGPALPPSRPRRRGAQPYEVPTRLSQQEAGPSSAPEQPAWERLALPMRPASNPDGYYPPPSVSLECHMHNVYSRPPTTLPPSAHSSPGSTHSAPAYFPAEHTLSSDPQPSQLALQPPMASLFEQAIPPSAFETLPRAHSEPIADVNADPLNLAPDEFFLDSFGVGFTDPLDPRGNYNYGPNDTWSGLGVQNRTDGKPEGDASNQAGAQMDPWVTSFMESNVGAPNALFNQYTFTQADMDLVGAHFPAMGNTAPAA